MEVAHLLRAEVNALSRRFSMAAEINENAPPSFLAQKQSPGQHSKTGDAVTMQQDDGATRRGTPTIRPVRQILHLCAETEVQLAAVFVQLVSPMHGVIGRFNHA